MSADLARLKGLLELSAKPTPMDRVAIAIELHRALPALLTELEELRGL